MRPHKRAHIIKRRPVFHNTQHVICIAVEILQWAPGPFHHQAIYELRPDCHLSAAPINFSTFAHVPSEVPITQWIRNHCVRWQTHTFPNARLRERPSKRHRKTSDVRPLRRLRPTVPIGRCGPGKMHSNPLHIYHDEALLRCSVRPFSLVGVLKYKYTIGLLVRSVGNGVLFNKTAYMTIRHDCIRLFDDDILVYWFCTFILT